MARSIKSKLIAIIGLITVGAIVVGVAIVVVNDVHGFRRDMIESTVLIASVVGEYSVSDLVFEDREAAGKTLEKLSGVLSIEYACLYDSGGRQMATYGVDDGTELTVVDFSQTVFFADGSLHVVEPVAYRGEVFGTLYLRASTAGLEAKICRRVVTGLVLFAILVALAMAVAVRLQRIISQPILDLAATTRRISETGNHSIRVESTGGVDEIAVLCEGFNDMLDQIQLRQLERDEAVHRTREKSHFLAAMSHELRTPLNSIIGFSEILLSRTKGRLEPKLLNFLKNIHSSGQHLLGIINDILDLSKVEAGQMELNIEPVSVHTVINGGATIMKGATQKRRIEVHIEGTSDLPLIEADRAKLKQVFFNLIS
ncbi:MAG: HAMP domain-containing protein, partial [Thermoanaerobaculales bacterium]|nr:HAMP domain-containing protein [Thermoanaerobaculales bacterium]